MPKSEKGTQGDAKASVQQALQPPRGGPGCQRIGGRVAPGVLGGITVLVDNKSFFMGFPGGIIGLDRTGSAT